MIKFRWSKNKVHDLASHRRSQEGHSSFIEAMISSLFWELHVNSEKKLAAILIEVYWKGDLKIKQY